MSQAQAGAIRDFVLALDGNVECLIVHCNAGMSRSPAVAAILCGLGQSDMYIWKSTDYRPNLHCYRMVLRAFGKACCLAQLKRRINEHAFRSLQRQNERKNRCK